MRTISMSILLAAALALATPGCKSDEDSNPYPHGHTSPYPTCDAIIKACHTVDLGEGKPSECHGLGHDATKDEDCQPKKDECLKACAEAAEAGLPGQDAGAD
jgi:hypothetical protein